ncbi:MAG: AsmA-like C-terminal region-containing protein, partial [Algisphaera sp.]
AHSTDNLPPRPPKTAQDQIEFDGRVELHDTTLSLGLPITGLRGSLLTHVRSNPNLAQPELSFDLTAQQLYVSDRFISPLNVRLANDRWADTLTFDRLLGSLYGGVIVGQGSVPLSPNGSYRINLNLSDVAVDPFLQTTSDDNTPNTPNAPPPQAFTQHKRDRSSGLLSASLSLEAPFDRPADRRGRGVLDIRDGQLFDRPISTAVLRATNFSLPSGSPLDSAQARYLIHGNTVRFDELSLSGPGLSIAGAGTMTLPNNNLRLLMVSRATQGPRLGPLSDLARMFKDELIAIKVRGTLSHPTTQVTALRGIRKSLDTLFSPVGEKEK